MYIVSCSIGHFCHLLRVVYWVHPSLRVPVRFVSELSLLKSLLLCIWSVERFYENSRRSFVSWIVVDRYWVWEMSNLLLGFPDHCLIYHSIISDMTFPSLHWYGLIIIHFAFFMPFYVFLTISFLIFVPPLIFFLHWYTFFIQYFLHIILLLYW